MPNAAEEEEAKKTIKTVSVDDNVLSYTLTYTPEPRYIPLNAPMWLLK